MNDFEARFNTLVDKFPDAPAAWLRAQIYQASEIATNGLAVLPQGIAPVDSRTWGYWVLESPAFDQYFTEEGYIERKINLIKDVRAAAHLGLKEAKDAVEYAEHVAVTGELKRIRDERLKLDAEALEKDVMEVIERLTGGADSG